MTNYFYYDSRGRKVGPATGEQLRTFAKNGKITPETIIETEEGKKGLAGNVRGFVFPAAILSVAAVSTAATVASAPNPFTNPVPDTANTSTAVTDNSFTVVSPASENDGTNVIGDFVQKGVKAFLDRSTSDDNSSPETPSESAVFEAMPIVDNPFTTPVPSTVFEDSPTTIPHTDFTATESVSMMPTDAPDFDVGEVADIGESSGVVEGVLEFLIGIFE